MKTVNIHEAKTQLSRLVEQASKGMGKKEIKRMFGCGG
jgi:hypothetical protein